MPEIERHAMTAAVDIHAGAQLIYYALNASAELDSPIAVYN